jgi:hypothetical protein
MTIGQRLAQAQMPNKCLERGRGLGQSGEVECPIQFWKFAVPIAAGSLSAGVMSLLISKGFEGAHPSTITAARAVTRVGFFWLVGGLTWAALNRNP